MNYARLGLIFPALFIALFNFSSMAGTTGKIVGEVTIAETGMAAVGTRITIEGTSMSTMVNPFDCSYKLQNIPPGIYNLIVRCAGYTTIILEGVVVHCDIITNRDFSLTAIDSTGQELRSKENKAEIPRVNSGELTAEDIMALPVMTLNEIIEFQNSLFQFSFNHKTGTIYGYIWNADNMAGISGATIELNGTKFRRFSNYKGNYIIEDIPFGQYSASVVIEGYWPIKVKDLRIIPGDSLNIDFKLQPLRIPERNSQTADPVHPIPPK